MQRFWKPGFLSGLALSVLLLAGCNASTVVTVVPTATATTAATSVPPTATPIMIPVKVYFSKHPDSDNDFTKVFAANRVSPTIKVGTYALEQLIVGPALSDGSGLYSQVKAALPGGTPAVGGATCGAGLAFALTITSGVGRMQFCVATSSGGIGDDARIENEITATLKQFNTVSSVKICTMDGDTFGNESGQKINC